MMDGETRTFRHVPYSEDTERQVLGSILLSADALDAVQDRLRPEHFYMAVHRRIYEACLTLRQRGQTPDPLTLGDYFDQADDLKMAGGGRAYLIDLAANVLGVSLIGDYVDTLVDLYTRRQLIELGQRLAEDAWTPDPERTGKDRIEQAESALQQLAETGQKANAIRTILEATHEAIERAQAAGRADGLSGVPTGLTGLDELTSGWQPGWLVIGGGRPAMGKTALACGTCATAAARAGHTVLIFSLEMPASELGARYLAANTPIDTRAQRSGRLSQMEYMELANGQKLAAQDRIFIDDSAAVSSSHIRAVARRIKRKHGLGLIIIDYLQLMREPGRFDNANARITETTASLKRTAKELGVPILLLSQLSRGVEARDDKRPMLSDLRDSGAIEQDADMVLGLFREAYYLAKCEPRQGANEDDDRFSAKRARWQNRLFDVENVGEILILKNRHGQDGHKLRARFNGAKSTFTDWSA